MASVEVVEEHLFYCNGCSTVFLSEADAVAHEKESGHIMCQLAPDCH
ncbi:MAG: hypothetical protein ABI347_03115 [Nitrososphaera sp.]